MSSSRPKRMSCEYFFEPQSKKIFCDESEEYKNSIYEKTMQKLRDGAKQPSAALQNVVNAVTPTKSSRLHSEVKRGLKQISLSQQGRLESDTKVTSLKDYCRQLPEKCTFCERLGCFTTLNTCTKCSDYFCDNCSFSSFIAREESRVCKSCFK